LAGAGAGTLLVALVAYARPYLKSIKHLPKVKHA
jgi:hypothetical protein